MPALFYLMRVQTDRRTDKQTYIQTGWGMVSARCGWPNFAASLLSILGAGVRDRIGRNIWSRACVQEHRYIGPLEPANICVSTVERYHCGNANKNIIPLSITLGSNHS